ncbi:unnamed protein product [Rhizophagus irregularis]|uniref:Uncharacterized protein n=1 Tax=Rhizophagus irregularis TaxID=588596 RepID=A0A2N1NJY2_9GLOM|nr:hypothetical protein RhiirC2_775166 [Rhizophagus irregularis]CAB5390316.1 unnamed protein product [Rhizophagus irregularis]
MIYYFRNLLGTSTFLRDLLADEIWEKKAERKELLMKQYRKREKPFDIKIGDTETPYTWWFQLKITFLKNENYLVVQLALKLFSITPHAAGCERVLSSLGCGRIELGL